MKQNENDFTVNNTLKTVTLLKTKNILPNTFNSFKALKTVTVHENICEKNFLLNIGNYAFFNCTSLEKFNTNVLYKTDTSSDQYYSIHYDNTIICKGINSYAFYRCSSLCSLSNATTLNVVLGGYIPNEEYTDTFLTGTGDKVFHKCTSIKELIFSDIFNMGNKLPLSNGQPLKAIKNMNTITGDIIDVQGKGAIRIGTPFNCGHASYDEGDTYKLSSIEFNLSPDIVRELFSSGYMYHIDSNDASVESLKSIYFFTYSTRINGEPAVGLISNYNSDRGFNVKINQIEERGNNFDDIANSNGYLSMDDLFRNIKTITWDDSRLVGNVHIGNYCYKTEYYYYGSQSFVGNITWTLQSKGKKMDKTPKYLKDLGDFALTHPYKTDSLDGVTGSSTPYGGADKAYIGPFEIYYRSES